jgi:hypothetical protein
MKRIVTWVAVVCTAALAACATVAPVQVNHYQTTLPDFPTLLVNATPVAAPPDQKTYLLSDTTWQQKEAMWLTAYGQQTTNVMSCNIDKTNISSWWNQQEAIVVKMNAADGTSAPVAASAGQASQ